ncbi:helix-turn-helix domain-containing protein [Paenibacillus sp. OV219]|uniref:AraC family transcriptional regulator n=1 Tax=Paenibacillus sp. OV219 TaxID=1884377 RepID=UPI0008ABA2C8|nr:helix-turn-helix domain-containing protein [Paenibacillus sp. OV219]SEO37601.1 AraC family transcriptional regulator, arabinose operon regulatory protein [Paenibacillus sp. OV219]
MSSTIEDLLMDKASSADCGTIVYSPGGQYGPRYQQDLQLVLLHTGHLNVTIDDTSHTITPGNVVLLKPGHLEFFEFAHDQETWHRWINVRVPEFTGEYEEQLSDLPFIIPISAELNKLTDLMLDMKPGATTESPQMRCIGLAALYQFSHEHKRENRATGLHASVAQAKNVIHNRFAESWTLNELAEQVNVTPEHLIRLFHTHENTTPMKYLWHYRVRQAAEMLQTTSDSVAEITLRCGFKSPIHFSRCLKQRTGKSPTEIRRESWQQK